MIIVYTMNEWMNKRKNEYGELCQKRVPVSLYPPQIPHKLPGIEPGPPQWKATMFKSLTASGKTMFEIQSVTLFIYYQESRTSFIQLALKLNPPPRCMALD